MLKLTCLLAFGVVAYADNLTSSSTCEIFEGQFLVASNVGTTHCSANDGESEGMFGLATASSSASFQGPIPGSPSTAVTVSITGIASAYPSLFGSENHGESIIANTQSTVDAQLFTIGPARAGFIEITNLAGGCDVGPDAANPFGASVSFGGMPNYFQCGQDFFGGHSGLMLPFELGTEFDLTGSAVVDASGFESTSGGEFWADYGRATYNLSFILLESDGQTAVQVYDTPEPSTMLLAGPLLFVCFGLWRLRDCAVFRSPITGI